MLSKRLEQALNKQVNFELEASYIYLFASVSFKEKGLHGFSKWFDLQAKEEREHAEKIIGFLHDRGCTVTFDGIPAVDKNITATVLEAFQNTLKHEQKVTSSITEILTIAIEEKDYPTENLMRWYVDEQVEEEATVNEILDALNYIKDDPFAIYEFNKELGNRTSTEE